MFYFNSLLLLLLLLFNTLPLICPLQHINILIQSTLNIKEFSCNLTIFSYINLSIFFITYKNSMATFLAPNGDTTTPRPISGCMAFLWQCMFCKIKKNNHAFIGFTIFININRIITKIYLWLTTYDFVHLHFKIKNVKIHQTSVLLFRQLYIKQLIRICQPN